MSEKEQKKTMSPKRMLDSLSIDFDLVAVIRVTFFSAALLMPYIYITHRSERNVRKLDELNRELKDLRAEYITLKSEHMSASKQSDVAARLAEHGLEELNAPPSRIVVKNGKH